MKKIPEIIQLLLSRLETVEVIEPETKIPEGATVVGVMPEELRRLIALRDILSDEHNELFNRSKKELETIDSRAEQKKAMEHIRHELHITDKKCEVINDLFWLGVRTTFPELNGKSSIGFGEGWQVYWKEDAPCQCLTCTVMRLAEFEIPTN